MSKGNYKHGKSKTKIYKIWQRIKRRCYYVRESNYKDYGGRGIVMQLNWVTDFLKFESYVTKLDSYNKENIGRKTKVGLSIDRINNDGNYEEGNLRWSTSSIQNRNKRMPSDNTSGYIGVSLDKRSDKFYATIMNLHLGTHEVASEAYKIRVDYIVKHQLEGFEVNLKTGKLKK